MFCSVVLAGDQDGAWCMVANISPLTYAIRALKIFLNLIDFIFPKIRGFSFKMTREGTRDGSVCKVPVV